ncbi:hypothetical protein GCM10009007_14540 [Formosimonas limnophila]|uniref:Uncharacterized protein n=1 Tax=Formosimonas limnophila TaxID=1384487 RepID=A0A8J3CNU0_9BURK|nr:hypothetical protein [Formosimonas limnophila]GHA74579.1 hypothetical protein GCM10009007_14540 [Formosimonas limnophila]
MKKSSLALLAVLFMTGFFNYVQAENTPNSAVESTVSADNSKGEVVEVKLSAKVIKIDKKKRHLTVQTENGAKYDLNVSEEIRNFDKIKVGDNLVIRYIKGIVLTLVPVNQRTGMPQRADNSSAATAELTQKPSALETHQTEIRAIVKAVNRKERKVTLRGAHETVTIDVPQQIDLGKVKVGDEVNAVITEAVAIGIEAESK